MSFGKPNRIHPILGLTNVPLPPGPDAGDLTAHLIRAGRYAVVIFVVIGVYPMLFKLTGKLWEKKQE